MNEYPEINGTVVSLVRKYAQRMSAEYGGKIEVEDLEQYFMLNILSSLKRFDIKKGNLYSFVNKCLYSKEIQLNRDLRVDKRKVFLYSINYDSIEAPKAETKEKETNKKNNPKTSQLLKLLPIGLRSLAKNLAKKESSNPVHQSDNFYVKVIKRILISNINNLKEAPLRNITYIETLSVRELSKLTETDLYDLQKR